MIRLPFFGLISSQAPFEKLKEHYDLIAEGMKLIEDALECYIRQGGGCPGFMDITKQVNELENQADKVKRNIRNHLPRGLIIPVDNTVFFNYTRSQDNILDDGQDALNWLIMRPMPVPKELQPLLSDLVEQVHATVALLRPALDSTVALILGKQYDRKATKESIRAVRRQHHKVWRLQSEILSAIYNADLDFKDIFQLIRFVEKLNGMSHNTEACADLLRAMLAR